jgi:MHS family proline/betaine transporter-like MFS transporter
MASSGIEGKKRLSKNKAIAAITIGNALEFFDFTVYGFMTSVIGKIFFPSMSAYNQLLLTVASFGVGFLMRPLGGIVIGAYADCAGRKKAMGLTITLMALGCVMMAFAPTPAQIGISAPLIIVAARLIQGFSAGGEVGASTTLLVEYARANERAYMGSWQIASQGLGVMVGALFSGVLLAVLSPAAMQSWGWRLPFVVGMLIAPVGIFIRRQLDESGTVSVERTGRRDSRLKLVLRDHWQSVLLASLMFISGTVGVYVIAFYMPTFAARELGLSVQVGLWAAVLFGAVNFMLAPYSGRLADRFGRKPVIVWSRIVLIMLLFPGFHWLLAAPSPARLYTLVGVLSVLATTQTPALLVMLTEMFPKEVRATGLSFVYSTVVAVFSGFSPFAVTWLVHESGNKLAPAWYLLGITVISTIVMLWIRDRTGETLDAADGADAIEHCSKSQGRKTVFLE